MSGESARALKRSVCDPRSPPAHGVRRSHCQRWWRPVPAALEPRAGGPGVVLGPLAPLGGLAAGTSPPHSQPPHTSVGPVRPVSPSPLVSRRPLVRVPSYSTAAPQAQVVAIGGRCVVSTWWGEEASMALAAAAVLEGAVAHPPPPN